MIPTFRMWNRITSQLHLVDGLYFDDKEAEYVDDDNVLRFIGFKSIDLMQSTGLKDKNGKEIFEGDVVRQVRTQPTTENEVIIGVVTMLEGAWLIMNDCEKLASDLWSETDENEIIGNIYENKDILEDKE